MPVLRSSTTSPFARKIRIAISILGLEDKIRIENADTLDPKDSVRQQNPLGKIPTLVFDDGSTLFDSRVILGYLDLRFGTSWRETHPKLVKWLDAFAKKVPAFAETVPH